MIHHDTLIDVPTLADRLAADDLVVVDCRFSLADPGLGRRQYEAGHIPGAFYAHLDDDLAGEIVPGSGRHPLPRHDDFAAWLNGLGITPDTQVVVYDDGPGAIAARLWWMLGWAGHRRAALLDGGFRAWTEDAQPVVVESPLAAPSTTAARKWIDGAFLSTGQLIDGLDEAAVVLVDARTAERFEGAQEPIDAVAGHVPGAVNLPFTGNLGKDGRFLDAATLARRFRPLLDGPAVTGQADRIVHMCGSGVTACHNLLAMEVAGLSGSRLYVGSWSEWIADPDRPVATGN